MVAPMGRSQCKDDDVQVYKLLRTLVSTSKFVHNTTYIGT